MKILVIIIILFSQSVSSGTMRDIQNPLTSASKSISFNGLFEHRPIPEDTKIDTKQDEDLSFTNVKTMILYGGLGVAALVVFLPMLVMGVFFYGTYVGSVGRNIDHTVLGLSTSKILEGVMSLPRFEHRQIPEDTVIDTKQDEDLSFTNVQTMILYGGLGVAALVIFLPMLVMGVFYLWMLYWFSCKGKKSFPDSSFPNTSNLVPNGLGDLDYLTGAVGMANDLWSGRCG